MGPTVTLEFKGEESDLMKAVDRAGDGVEQLGDRVEKTTKDIRGHSKAFDAMGEGTDKAEKKFTGFKDTLDGSINGLAAFNDSSLSMSDKMMAMGQSAADLSGGLTDFLIPAISSVVTFMRGGLASAMTFIAAHPLIIALIALVAIFVLLWMHSQTFRDIVIGVFKAVGDFFVNVFKKSFDFVVGLVQGYLDIYISIGKAIVSAFSAVAEGIKNAFKAAFNFVADAWNNTVGRLQFNIPSWVPGIGGNSFGVPKMPKFHTGINTVPGGPGTEMVATLQAGERILSATENSGAGTRIHVTGDARSWLYQVIKHGLKNGDLRLV